MARDVTLTTAIQEELENVTQADTEAMNEEQLRSYTQDVKKGLNALARLPTTSRLNELLKEQQSVKDAEARISELLEEGENWKREATLATQRLAAAEGTVPECSHGDLEEEVRILEQQLEERHPDLAELKQDLEDAQAQMEIFRSWQKKIDNR